MLNKMRQIEITQLRTGPRLLKLDASIHCEIALVSIALRLMKGSQIPTALSVNSAVFQRAKNVHQDVPMLIMMRLRDCGLPVIE